MEMMYLDGGGVKDFTLGLLAGLTANALSAVGKKVSKSMVLRVLAATSVRDIWTGISAAAVWVWNTPVALGILAGVTGVAIGVVIGYYGLK